MIKFFCIYLLLFSLSFFVQQGCWAKKQSMLLIENVTIEQSIKEINGVNRELLNEAILKNAYTTIIKHGGYEIVIKEKTPDVGGAKDIYRLEMFLKRTVPYEYYFEAKIFNPTHDKLIRKVSKTKIPEMNLLFNVDLILEDLFFGQSDKEDGRISTPEELALSKALKRAKESKNDQPPGPGSQQAPKASVVKSLLDKMQKNEKLNLEEKKKINQIVKEQAEIDKQKEKAIREKLKQKDIAKQEAYRKRIRQRRLQKRLKEKKLAKLKQQKNNSNSVSSQADDLEKGGEGKSKLSKDDKKDLAKNKKKKSAEKDNKKEDMSDADNEFLQEKDTKQDMEIEKGWLGIDLESRYKLAFFHERKSVNTSDRITTDLNVKTVGVRGYGTLASDDVTGKMFYLDFRLAKSFDEEEFSYPLFKHIEMKYADHMLNLQFIPMISLSWQTHVFANLPVLGKGIKLGVVEAVWLKLAAWKEWKMFNRLFTASLWGGHTLSANGEYGEGEGVALEGMSIGANVGAKVWKKFCIELEYDIVSLTGPGEDVFTIKENALVINLFYKYK